MNSIGSSCIIYVLAVLVSLVTQSHGLSSSRGTNLNGQVHGNQMSKTEAAFGLDKLMSRRFFFGLTSATMIAGETSQASIAASTPEASLPWLKVCDYIRGLEADYSTLAAGGGDAVRVALGTAGNSAASPLFQVEKMARGMMIQAEDPVQFGDALEDFLYHYRQADSMAYSANFAGGSGKPKPPAVYLKLAGDEIKQMSVEANRMAEALSDG